MKNVIAQTGPEQTEIFFARTLGSSKDSDFIIDVTAALGDLGFKVN